MTRGNRSVSFIRYLSSPGINVCSMPCVFSDSKGCGRITGAGRRQKENFPTDLYFIWGKCCGMFVHWVKIQCCHWFNIEFKGQQLGRRYNKQISGERKEEHQELRSRRSQRDGEKTGIARCKRSNTTQ